MRKVKIGIVIAAVVVGVVVIAFALMGGFLSPEWSYTYNWNDNHPLGSSAYVHLEGTVTNSGNRNYSNVELMISPYESNRLLKTETFDLGDFPANSSKPSVLTFSIRLFALTNATLT